MAPRGRETLQVLLHDVPVAELRNGSALTLTYHPEVVDRLGVGALCLSATLPVRPKAYQDPTRGPGSAGQRRPVEFWCEGLLPEGETRTMLEGRFGVRRGDTFALLAAIGAECAGAVSFADATASSAARPGGVVLDDDALIAAVENLPSRPLGVDDEVRVSLGGLQAKLLLTRSDGGWTRPGPGVPSTHIVKPDPRDLARPGLVAAAALVLRAAAHAAISAASVELIELGGRLAIVVERYDRVRTSGGRIGRVHQEDGCQALGLNPLLQAKYQARDDVPPSFSALAALLRDHSGDVDEQLRRLGQQMVLSWAVGNTDGHARNFSLLVQNGTMTLAPAYDVAPTHLFASAPTLGLWVGGQSYLRYVTRGHVAREMVGWGLPEPVAADVLDSTLRDLPDALRRAAAELGELVAEDLVEATLGRVGDAARTSW